MIDKKRRDVILQKLKHETNLIGEDLSETDLSNIDFSREGIFGFHGTRQLTRVNFSGSNLNDIDFTQTRLIGAKFTKANLERADFTEANVNGADFRFANLRAVNFHLADLRNAHLQGADLADAYLGDANVIGANFDNVKFNNETVLPDGTTWREGVTMDQFVNSES